MNRVAILILATVAVSACKFSDDGDDSLQYNFDSLSNYQSSDFNLVANYDYWEIRTSYWDDSAITNSNALSLTNGSPSGRSIALPPLNSFSTLLPYDLAAYSTLDSLQIDLLNQTLSREGFLSGCRPADCPIYAVAIAANEVELIASDADLLLFFEKIDTEAELFIWLWAQGYRGDSYEPNGDGFMVVAYDNNCGNYGKNLLYVDAFGSIKRLRKLEEHSSKSCA